MPRSPSPDPSSSRRNYEGEQSRNGDRGRRYEDYYDSGEPSSSRRRGADVDGERRRRRSRSGERDRERRRDRDDEERYRSKRRPRGDDKEAEEGETRRDRSRSRDRDRDRDKERRREKRRRERDRERDRDKDSRSPSVDDDRRRRKALKAQARENARRETEAAQARALAEVSMYSANDNPFHDANLGEQFQWHKKREKEKKAGLSIDQIARKDAIRRQEAKEELERLNKKRADREVEMALREEEEIRMKRLAEDAQMKDWHAREDDFQLEQSRRRAGIRLREQRAKAIDFLAINLRFADAKALGRHTAAIGALAEVGKRGLTNQRRREVEREEEEEGWGWADAGFEFEIDEPWKIFENLNMEDCVELEQDIKMYLSMEKSPINIEFWEAMQVVCQHHLGDLQDPDHAAGGRLFDKSVNEAAGNIVSGLSFQRLVELENKTNAMLRSGQPVDGEFWDLVLKKIDLEKAIARLNAIHEVVLKNRLEQFKKRQREDAAQVQAELGGTLRQSRPETNFGGDMHAEAGEVASDADDEMDEDDWVEEYDPTMSPPPALVGELSLEERRLPIRTSEEEFRALLVARREITNANFIPRHVRAAANGEEGITITSQTVAQPSQADLEAERIYRAEAIHERKDLHTDESEEEFGDLDDGLLDAPPPTTYDWNDRFRPRKPRYFNRVLTGFEWSKYNQTHYDTDNPPPKVVQGYKFNIFYPDLIDKSVAPIYKVVRIPNDDETQMIVFTAGPPYEDIAFRIVRRPWEYSHRRGFRSNFDRGVLQLYFNFGRSFYRK